MKALFFTLFFFLGMATSWCQTRLIESNQDDRYYSQLLERKAELMADSMYNLEKKLTTSKIIMLKENVKKKMWIKVLVAETVVVAGVILVATTGLLVPVCMGVIAIETFLLVEGNYRLNLKKIKKLRRESPENLKTYLN